MEFTEWFAEWLRCYRLGLPRDTRLVMASGERRGGKTFNLVMASVATAIAVPGSIVWMVSPSYPERDELERTIREYFPVSNRPEAWATYRGIPQYRFHFRNGSVIQSISSDDPDTLKRGRADLVFLNEAQKHPIAALTNSIPGTIDRGGLVMLATNPPRSNKGKWVLDLKDAIDEETIAAARYFTFRAGGNDSIDASAKGDVGQILGVLDPRAKAADDDGLWLPVGDRAYHEFRKRSEGGRVSNLGAVPDIGDVTAAVLKRKGITARPYRYIVGADFQIHPWHVGIAWRAFGDPARPVYWAVGEVFTPEHEEDFIDDLIEAGYGPDDAVVIGDASGTWQDGAHRRGKTSFDFFKARRYRIEAPRVSRDEHRHPRNPDVGDRVGLFNRLLAQGRIMIDPRRCPRLVEALHECSAKDGRPVGVHAHAGDGASYGVFWMEPAPRRVGAVDASKLLDRTASRPSPI